MKALSVKELREICPVKWHDGIPEKGISLGIADVDFHGPVGVLDYIKSHLREEFSFYQQQQGLSGAIDAIKSYFKSFNYSIDEEKIQVIEGTMMGISIAMQWIGEKEGDILMLGPIYEPIHSHATRHKNNLVWSNITKEGIDQDEIEGLIEKNKIKMISICNPTNPIGHVFTREELEFLRDMTVKHDLYLFSDELYAPLVFDKEYIPAPSIQGLEDRTISLYGFSKAYGLAGYRSGFMHVGPAPMELRYLASQYMVSPSPIASIICEYALTHPSSRDWVLELRKHCKETTSWASNYLTNHDIKTDRTDGCFFVFPDIGVNDVDFSQYLFENYAVQTVAGSVFGPSGKEHLRINCATSRSLLYGALSKLNKRATRAS